MVAAPSIHSSCPPDDDRSSWRSVELQGGLIEANIPAPEVLHQPSPSPPESHTTGSTDTHIAEHQQGKRMDIDEEASAPDILSPMSAEADKQQDESDLHQLTRSDLGSPSMGYDFSNIRVSIHPKRWTLSLWGLTTSSAHSFFPFVLPTRW
jgi:glucose-induced degradation protein 4